MSGLVTDTTQRQGARQRLADPTAWRTLGTAADAPSFTGPWLALLAAQIDVALAAPVPTSDGRVVNGGFVALRQDGAQRFVRAGRYGEGDPSLLLQRAAERCLQMRRPVVQNSDAAGAACQLVVPILTGERLDGAVAIELDGGASVHLDACLRIVQWGLGWYARLLERRADDEGAWTAETALAALELLHTDASTKAASQAMCTLLASRLDVARVSIGLGAEGEITPVGTSGGALATTPTDFIIALRSAMAEAAAAKHPLFHAASDAPSPASGADAPLAATGAHQRLCRSHGSAWALSLPVLVPPGTNVVITIEGEHAPPAQEQAQRWDAIARAIAPAMLTRGRAERGLLAHASEAVSQEAALLRGKPGRNRIIALSLTAAALGLFFFGHGDYRVSARATLEGVVKRAMVSPFDTYLAEALARPGDRVKAGTLLARLDDRDLRLQQADQRARRGEAQRQMDEAIGRRDMAAAGIAAAHRDQADADLALITENLGRTQLTAPFDGIVISGDPAQNIGAPLRRGDIIYELSPLDAFRVAIDVDQVDFADVVPGQTGTLVLTPLPTASFPLRVTAVTPVATARDGRTAFRVDAALVPSDLPGQEQALRPGMQGIAKIDAGPRRHVWIWTHDMVNWLRLKIWEYRP